MMGTSIPYKSQRGVLNIVFFQYESVAEIVPCPLWGPHQNLTQSRACRRVNLFSIRILLKLCVASPKLKYIN
jgi:hypothetical protein